MVVIRVWLMIVSSSVFLIGAMGSGKTAVGRCLAARLGCRFFDTDDFIQKRVGSSVADIFDRQGEEKFREYEEQALAELTRRDGIVLATGGGAVLSAANRRHLYQRGTVVWLYADVDSRLDRIGDIQVRPLLAASGDVRARLEELDRQRQKLYMNITDIFVDVGSREIAGVVDRIIDDLSLRREDRQRH